MNSGVKFEVNFGFWAGNDLGSTTGVLIGTGMRTRMRTRMKLEIGVIGYKLVWYLS